MDNILLATIHRSFTNSVFAMLNENRDDVVTRLHVWPKGILAARTGDYDKIITTYRNPRDVAESWAKRSSAWRSGLWIAQWEAWAELVPMADKIYRVEDLDRKLGSFGYGVKRNAHVPEAEVKYAEGICREVLNV